jgi:hypothetical protein
MDGSNSYNWRLQLIRARQHRPSMVAARMCADGLDIRNIHQACKQVHSDGLTSIVAGPVIPACGETHSHIPWLRLRLFFVPAWSTIDGRKKSSQNRSHKKICNVVFFHIGHRWSELLCAQFPEPAQGKCRRARSVKHVETRNGSRI